MRRAARLFELVQRSCRLCMVTVRCSRTSQFARAIARCVSVEASVRPRGSSPPFRSVLICSIFCSREA